MEKIKNEYGFVEYQLIIDTIEIVNIEVLEKFRNQGHGTELLKKLISFAKDNNCKKINLEVSSNNLIAKHLYDKFNFEQNGLRKEYYKDGSDAILMTLYI